MAFGFPVEPARILSFARSLGDTGSVYRDQLFARLDGEPLVTPPTFVRSAGHYRPDRAEVGLQVVTYADASTVAFEGYAVARRPTPATP